RRPWPRGWRRGRAGRRRHPDTTVLSLETGHERPYVPGLPYGRYFESPSKMFPALETRQELGNKERFYGLAERVVAKAWPLAELVEQRVIDDELGGKPVVLVALEGSVEVAARSPSAGFLRYNAGGAVRAYARGDVEFSLGADDATLRDEEGGA